MSFMSSSAEVSNSHSVKIFCTACVAAASSSSLLAKTRATANEYIESTGM